MMISRIGYSIETYSKHNLIEKTPENISENARVIEYHEYHSLAKGIKMVYDERKCLDGIIRAFLETPRSMKGLYILIKKQLYPVGFDWLGKPYFLFQDMKVYFDTIRDAEEMLEDYEEANDYCDNCGYPLEDTPDDILRWEEDGTEEAYMFYCPRCDYPNRRNV